MCELVAFSLSHSRGHFLVKIKFCGEVNLKKSDGDFARAGRDSLMAWKPISTPQEQSEGDVGDGKGIGH
jgi:hypothetical protein